MFNIVIVSRISYSFWYFRNV